MMKKVKLTLLFFVFLAMCAFVLAHSYFVASTGIVLCVLAATGIVLWVLIGPR